MINNISTKAPGDAYSKILLAITCLSALLYTGDHIYHLSFMWVALLFWFISLVYEKEEIIVYRDAITLVCVGYILWLASGVVLHPVTETWLLYTFRLSVLPFAILCSYYLLRKSDVAAVFYVLVLVGLFDAFVTLYQSFLLGVSADGFFANRNNNAAFLNILMLPVLSLLILEDSGVYKKLGLMAVVVVFLLCVLQISSRGAYISLFVSMSLLYGYAFYKKKYRNILAVSSLILVVMLVNGMHTEVEIKTDFSSHSRWLLWISSIDMLKDASWYGIGNGMFHLAYPQYKIPDEKSLGLFVHNDYMQILLELGIPGLILFLSIFILVLLASRKMLVSRADIPNQALYFGMQLAIITVMIHSLVTFNFYMVSILLVLGVYIGLILRQARSLIPGLTEVTGDSLTRVHLIIATIVILVAVIQISRSGYADGVLDSFLNKDLVNSPIDVDYRIYDKLGKIDPHRYNYLMSKVWASIGMSVDKDATHRLEILKQSRLDINKAKTLNPYAVDVYLVEAQLEKGFSDVAGANWKAETITKLEHALTINPGFIPVRMILAELLVKSDRTVEALGVLQDGLAYIHRYGYIKYYGFGANIALKVGDEIAYARFTGLLESEKNHNLREFEEMLQEHDTRGP